MQGTLYGAGAGAHVLGAIVAVGALWYIARSTSPLSPATIAVVVLLTGIILVADAKQVVFALPAVLIAQRGMSARTLAVGVVVVGCLVALLQSNTLNQGYAVPYVDRALSGDSGKQAVAESLWNDAQHDLGTLTVGSGPAETVSRTAFQTVPAFQKQGSGLESLGLQPASKAIEENRLAASASGATETSPQSLDSFDSAESSGLGVFGDLGMLGVIAYVGLGSVVFLALRRRSSPEASAAIAGLAMALVLGFVLDWWEQPPFTVFLATLAGIALSEPVSEHPLSTE